MSTIADQSFSLGPALLFCPADRPERYAKAAGRSDAVILDLEDAVSPAQKPQARRDLRGHLLTSEAALLERTVVRVSPAATEDFTADVGSLTGTGVRYVMLAKAESPADLDAVAAALPGVGVVALCETAAGVVAAEQIAAHPAAVALMWGAEDLIASIGGTSSRRADGPYRDVAASARSRVLLTAAAQSKAAIDSIYADISDHEGLTDEASDAVGSGFAAKACIHPSHVRIIREAYTPSAEEAEHARSLLEATDGRQGVFEFRGQMVDGPLIRHAERIVQRADALAAEDQSRSVHGGEA